MCSKERKLIWRKTLPVVIIAELLRSISAHVAELVDAHGSGPCAARCGGSSPSVGTTKFRKKASHQAERAQDRALSRWEAFFIPFRVQSLDRKRPIRLKISISFTPPWSIGRSHSAAVAKVMRKSGTNMANCPPNP